MCCLQNEQDSTNADISEELWLMLCIWLNGESEQKSKVDTRTPQAKPRSDVRNFLMQRHELGSDGPSDEEQEQDTVGSKIKQMIAEKKSTCQTSTGLRVMIMR